MRCPECNTELFCHCSNCITRNKDKVRWLWEVTEVGGETIELEYCGNCGYKNSPCFWADLEIDQLFESEGVNSFKELSEKRKERNENRI